MCGICGVLDINKNLPVSEAILIKMNELLSHRGPDDCGVYINRFIGFGHRRLSVIDLAGGRQPMSNEDGTVWVTYNGEIYNYREFGRELLQNGHRFATDSDTEVIVHGYEEYGWECVSKLNGMFSFALWDEKKNLLFLARDRLGIKPLYYAAMGPLFIFASEIKAILAHPQVRAEVDINAISEYLLCTTLLDSRTMFKNIRSVQPGTAIVIENGAVTINRYWALERDGLRHTGNSFADCREEVRRLLDSAVEMESVSDVPLGTLLSGGLDSSLVSAMAARHNGGRLRTFSMGYDKNRMLRPDDTDPYYARLVADAYGTDHKEFIFQPEEYFDVMENVAWHVEKPVELTSPSLFLLYRSVKPRVTVVMSGEGADELFAGYYFFLERCNPKRPEEFPWAPYLDAVSTLLSPDIKKETRCRERVRATLADEMAAFESEDETNKLLYLFLKYYLVDLLERLDKTSMAWGVESRVPFLDHRLVEFVINMPSSYKSAVESEKILLKSIATDMLPACVVKRKKRPVPIPVDPKTVFNERNKAKSLVQSAGSRIAQYFDRRQVDDFFRKRRRFATIDNLAIYRTSHALISLDAWHKAFGVSS